MKIAIEGCWGDFWGEEGKGEPCFWITGERTGGVGLEFLGCVHYVFPPRDELVRFLIARSWSSYHQQEQV